MEELDKWKSVNSCETFDELCDALDLIGPVEYSSGRMKPVDELKMTLSLVKGNSLIINYVTRNYGLRSKVAYLLYYKEK